MTQQDHVHSMTKNKRTQTAVSAIGERLLHDPHTVLMTVWNHGTQALLAAIRNLPEVEGRLSSSSSISSGSGTILEVVSDPAVHNFALGFTSSRRQVMALHCKTPFVHACCQASP